MQTTNPFELILSRLDLLQSTVDNISQTARETTKQSTYPERLLDIPEAAQIVHKPVATVRHYIHHRNLPATKIGKSYLIKLNQLLSWVDDFDKKAQSNQKVLDPMLKNRIRYRKSNLPGI